MKTCRVCEQHKPITDFHVDRNKRGGRASRCKECVSAHLKAYYATHRSQRIEAAKASYEKQPEQRKAYVLAWRRANRNLARQYGKKWDAENRAARTAHAGKRRAQRNLSFPIWADEAAIKAVYQEARRLTALTGEQHHVDHIVPLQSKIVCGLHVPSNLQVLPWLQNVLKHNRVWPDMPETS